jgi:pyruvate dehydrogenase E1 component alpha subunit
MDAFVVHKATTDMIELARKGEPSLLEIRTYRYRGHSMSDPAKYRTKDELDRHKEDDPVLRVKAYILENKLEEGDRLEEIDEEVKAEVMESVTFAEESPLPALETIWEDIYVQDDYPFIR